MSAVERKELKSLRGDLKQAIKDGSPISRRIGFKIPQMYRMKEATIHLSPLKVRRELKSKTAQTHSGAPQDLDGVVDAYVAV